MAAALEESSFCRFSISSHLDVVCYFSPACPLYGSLSIHANDAHIQSVYTYVDYAQ